MRERWVGIFAGFLLLLYPSQIEVAEAANPGSKSCAKLGKLKFLQGMQHQCVRKNGKLIWVPKTSKKIVSIKPTSSKISRQYQPPPSAVTEPPNQNETSTSPPVRISELGETFTKEEFPIIGRLASELVPQKSVISEGKFEIEWDSSTAIDKRKSLSAQIDFMKTVYSPMIPSNGLLKIIVIGSNVEWAQERLRLASIDNPDLFRDYGNKFVVSKKCSAPGGFVNPDNTFPEPFTTFRGSGGGTVPGRGVAFVTMSNCDNYVEHDILFHEAFHSVQWLNSFTSAKYLGSQSLGWGRVPPWFKEGQAQYFGYRMSEQFKKQSVLYDRDEAILSNLDNTKGWRSNYELLASYKTSTPYWIGALLYEYLLAKFGLEKTLLVFDATVKRDEVGAFDEGKRYTIFDEAFLEVFGQSRESFIAEAAIYVDWLVERALANK